MKKTGLLLSVLFIPFFLINGQSTQEDISWTTLCKSAWPMVKHDPQFTGRSSYKGPQTPNIIWTADMKDGIFSGPVLDKDDNLYFGSYYQLSGSDNFYSYSKEGELRWEYNLGNGRPPQSGILIDSSNTIYFGSLDKYFYALNPDGTLKWKYETGYITEIVMPNIDLQGRIYITNNPEGELISLNPNGELNWKVKYENGFLQKSPVIAPDGNTIYVAGRDSNVYAINLDGSLKWKFRCGKIQRFPIIDNKGNLYFIPEVIPQKIYSLKPDNSIRWEDTIISTSLIQTYSTPTIDYDGNIYIAIGSSILSYDYEGTKRWWYIIGNSTEEYDDFWQPLICDNEGTIYIGSTFGYYYYAISSEGKLKWKLYLNEYQVDNTGAIGEDGTLYIGVHKSSLLTGLTKTLIAIRDSVSTDVDNVELIDNFKLNQNYPNPFNPSTTIKFTIPVVGAYSNTPIRLAVYDILGREVKTLVDENKTAGEYFVTWDGKDKSGNEVSSGIYFYNIKFMDHSITKKMLMVK